MRPKLNFSFDVVQRDSLWPQHSSMVSTACCEHRWDFTTSRSWQATCCDVENQAGMSHRCVWRCFPNSQPNRDHSETHQIATSLLAALLRNCVSLFPPQTDITNTLVHRQERGGGQRGRFNRQAGNGGGGTGRAEYFSLLELLKLLQI